MSIVGKWNLIVRTPMGEQSSTLVLNDDGTGLTSSPLGSSNIDDVKIDGARATFTVKIEVMGREYVLNGSATADGDSITGKYESGMGVSGFTGHRATT
jgi:hypothetical protein